EESDEGLEVLGRKRRPTCRRQQRVLGQVMGKQRTVHGAYSGDFEESKVTGLSRDAYYPSRKPGVYVANDGLKGRIFLDTDNDFSRSQWPAGARGRGGFSSPVSD